MTNRRAAKHATGARLLAEAIASCRRGFVAVVAFSFCINILMLAAPLYMLQLFDRVLTSRSTDTLLLLTIIAIAAILTMALLDIVRNALMVRLGAWLEARLGGPVLAESIAGILRRGKDPSVQGLRDLSTVRTFLTGPAMFPVLDAPWTPLFIAIIFLMHPVLGWVALGGALVLFTLALLNDLTTRKLLQRSSGASIGALQQAEAAARNADVIEAMGMVSNIVRRWNERNGETIALQNKASRRSGVITASSKFVRLCLQIGLLGTGALLVIGGELTPGAMIAASILMGRALAPVEQAIGSWRQAIAARASYQRIREHLAAAPLRGDAMKLPEPAGALSVEGVWYAHPAQREPVLRNVSFQLNPGESLGLIGPSAAGKSTLARLIVGNLTPRSGNVRLDGADMATWHAEDRGQYVGYLPQDVELFEGTVRENIARMDEGDTDAIITASRLAGVHDMVLRLPDGYETEIGEGGAALSGGERQRIALARAVYGGPRLIVLDEPNASLDRAGEEALVSAIAEIKEQGATLVVIAHRPSILRHIDKILILQEGAVQAFGTRDEVLPTVAGPTAQRERAIDAEGAR